MDDNRHQIALKLANYLDASTTASLPLSRINVLYEKFTLARTTYSSIVSYFVNGSVGMIL